MTDHTKGCKSLEDITIFDSSGLSVQDLFIAQAILDLVNS
ncbi:MAG: hypothetical protein ACSHXB_13545 [Sulfitobacter sp.]